MNSVSDNRPSFEEYVSEVVGSRENGADEKTKLIYMAFMLEMRANADHCRRVTALEGEFAEESEEFKTSQKYFWFYYKRLTIVRSCVQVYYGLHPDWRHDVQSEHVYLGRLTSKEDTDRYMRAPPPGCGLTLMKPETLEESMERCMKPEDDDVEIREQDLQNNFPV